MRGRQTAFEELLVVLERSLRALLLFTFSNRFSAVSDQPSFFQKPHWKADMRTGQSFTFSSHLSSVPSHPAFL